MATPLPRPAVVCGIFVAYNKQPHGTIGEIDGRSNELMKGQGGSDVYLVAEYTRGWRDGLTGASFAHCKDARGGWADLAKGAGGNYVYIETQRDTDNASKFVDVALWRSDSYRSLDDARARGYDGMSNDINTGRGHGFLYLEESPESRYCEMY